MALSTAISHSPFLVLSLLLLLPSPCIYLTVQWVQNNVVAYSSDIKFRYISVGNEVGPKSVTAPFVLWAMQNVYNALEAVNLQGQIKVSTTSSIDLIDFSYPSADVAFKDNVKFFIKPIISFLVQNNAPFLAKIFPYFVRIGNPSSVPLDFALFKGQPNGTYTNLFDAMLDAFYSAVESEGGSNVEIVVSETGWPSAGGADASVANAQTYYSNLINHVKGTRGTPKRPGKAIETYLFAMFDEDEKPGPETEEHFGLFTPDKQPKYQLSSNFAISKYAMICSA
ncbi:unnamed protein product [Thlaspi arvense]|uniref:glucan endo-1,3-beta-D-glucosidase n=1 Tax=Thlaspi arvense TaxID=13288 RepID=A0AAU9RVT5_THLAR|nr:unnamed protein product [Thlaspi arvense]